MVIPTFLEAESIAAVVAALPRDIVDRVVVVDGGSPDGTTEEVACRAGAEVITVGRGYGRAWARKQLRTATTIVPSWTATVQQRDPMALTRGWSTRSAPAASTLISDTVALGKREEGSMAGH